MLNTTHNINPKTTPRRRRRSSPKTTPTVIRATPISVCASAARDTTHEGENDDEEEETGSSRKQQKSACFALPWCVDFHALFTFPSVVSQVRGARPSVGPERAKRKLGGKTSRTSRVFPSEFFGDRIFVLCGFLQKEGKARLRA